MFLIVTRHDKSYAVSVLSKFLSKNRRVHWTDARSILLQLKQRCMKVLPTSGTSRRAVKNRMLRLCKLGW